MQLSIEPYAAVANQWMATTVPLDMRLTVFIAACIVAFIINRKAGYGLFGFLFITLLVYGFLRWVGLGG